MRNKIAFLIIILVFFLVGCGEKFDDEALEKIGDALEKRWEYTEQLPDEVSVEELEKAVQTELDILEEYSVDDFKDISLYALYDNYRRDLVLIKTLMNGKSADSPDFQEKWKEHLEKRSKTLYDLNDNYDIYISDEHVHIFEEVLAGSKYLVEAEKVEESLSDINALTDIDIVVEDNSIVINFPTESALSTDSFVARKTGFTSYAMEILEIMKEYDYENIIVTTTNQDSIAISTYFTKKSLNNIDFDKWEETDSYDAYKFYGYTDAYYIRLGIWEELNSETKQSIGEMNKDSSEPFWEEHGFTY